MLEGIERRWTSGSGEVGGRMNDEHEPEAQQMVRVSELRKLPDTAQPAK
jgi:hypothetical protein